MKFLKFKIVAFFKKIQDKIILKFKESKMLN